ncbi:MAG: DNA polymerase III subunit alpha [Candidatus Eisenbacteria bacterium]|uniref:DNA polymerase III subunit alpha n=1 Tax=Eiseniibacteriota bacterium TaxID=2212470 RepID=A0A956N8F3_UNCEI|nr:DNA polymerase III subunit alpha [Candidatus Eisenbacteria bacterium]
MSGFVHLHTHSHYSLLYGACRIPDLVKSCAELGMSSVALTDRGNLFGAVEFYEAATAAGVRPILGCEILVRRTPVPERPRDWDELRYRIHLHDSLVLLAKNDLGYLTLMKLVSRGYLGDSPHPPEVTWEELAEHKDGLIAISGALSGTVSRYLREDRWDKARERLAQLKAIYGPDLYLELVDHGLPDHRALVKHTADLGQEMDVPLVVSNHVHYLLEDHADAHDALLCIQTAAQKVDERRFRFETREMYLKSPDQMADLFEEYPEALENTVRIADQCKVEMEFGKLKLPPFPKPDEFDSLDDFLEKLCRDGLAERYDELTTELTDRLDFELGIIKQMGYSGYFLITQDFIRYARSIGVPVGPGRGSAAGSLVSYCLGITNIDPIRYQLLFERFLNPERVSMPDIDVDFSDRGRGKVIQYVVEKYGIENVCQIITFGTMAARAAVRDVGRVMGMSPADVDHLAKMVPEEIGIKLAKALEKSPDLAARYENDPQVKELIEIALVLEGLSRHASTHAAGVIITPSALTEYVPLHRAGEEEITTQFDMVACDKIGLLKMDFLGLRTLTVLEDCLWMLSLRGIEVDLDALELTDDETFALFGRGETVGVFQFESSGMVEYLRKLKPQVIDDLIAMNALYRPGPLGSGMVDDFILRKQGEKKIVYEHPVLEPILRDTYGVIVYQEQVMQIASAMAGYSLGEADLLRRAMGKKKKEVMAAHRATFVERSVEKKVPEHIAATVFDLMAHFAGYGFNKSHSAGYALVAYHTGYLKAHYPVEFMAAALTSEMSKPDRLLILLAETRRMEIEVLPPSIGESEDGFRATNGKIRFGLGAVKGVGHGAVAAIVHAREQGGAFLGLHDLAERVDTSAVNKKCLEALIQAGALDAFGEPRARLFEGLPTVLEWAARRRRERELGQVSLFGDSGGASPRPPLPDRKEWESADKLEREKSALGFYLTGHPLDRHAALAEQINAIPCGKARTTDSGEGSIYLGLPIQVKVSQDKKGRSMAFFTLEDASGTVDALCFEEPLQYARPHLEAGGPVYVKAKLSRRKEEQPKLIVEEVQGLAAMFERGKLSLHVAVATAAEDALLQSVKECLTGHSGGCPVYLHVDHRKLEGVIVKSRSLEVEPSSDLVEGLREILGPDAVRLTVGQRDGFRSQDVFGRAQRGGGAASGVRESNGRNPADGGDPSDVGPANGPDAAAGLGSAGPGEVGVDPGETALRA